MTKRAPRKSTPPHDDFERDLINIVAHDLKTPISATKGFIELIQHLGPLNEQQQKFAQRALLSLERMEALVHDLLDLSRAESSGNFQMAPLELTPLIEEAFEMLAALAEPRRITLRLNAPEAGAKVAMVNGDVRWLRQAVHNLLSNAVKYNREGGSVEVTLADHRDADGAPMVRLEVRDTGIGIAPEDQKRVFEQFFRADTDEIDAGGRGRREGVARRPEAGGGDGRRVEGTGLGLAITERIIQRHHGRIWVTSTPGEGSTFSTLLPAASRARQGKATPVASLGRVEAGESADGIDDALQDSSEKIEVDSRSEER